MDHRDRVNMYGNGWPEHNIDTNRMTVTFSDFENDEGEFEDIVLPFKFQVCSTCNGKGSHVNPSIDSHGLTSEDFYEDPDFAEDYFSGVYDVACYECGGKNVTPEIDSEEIEKRGTEQQKKWLKLLDDYMNSYWNDITIREAERRMGA